MTTRRGLSNVVSIRTADDGQRNSILEKIIDEHAVSLRRFLRIRLANSSDREDIAQEVYLRLYRQKGLEEKLSRGVESTRAYLFTIAANLIRDMKRRATVRHFDSHERFDDAAILDERQSIEEQVQRTQSLEVAARCIEHLPAKQGRAFVMSRFLGMSYREISEKMGVSCSAVEKYISAALTNIRSDIEE